jgi:hypothetical protein
MVARFTKDKYGWRCTNVWKRLTQEMAVDSTAAPFAIFVNVSRAPRLGFSKRPHFYL